MGKTIYVRTARNGIKFNLKEATAPRICKHGCTIQVGERYLRQYNVKEGKIADSWNFCKNHFAFCQFCMSPFFEQDKAFCSESCTEEHFRLAQVDAEENSFWADESEYGP